MVGLLGPERVQPCHDCFGVVGSGEVVETVPHQLVEADPPRGGDPPGLGNDSLVDGEGDLHEPRLGVHGVRVNWQASREGLDNLGDDALLMEPGLT